MRGAPTEEQSRLRRARERQDAIHAANGGSNAADDSLCTPCSAHPELPYPTMITATRSPIPSSSSDVAPRATIAQPRAYLIALVLWTVPALLSAVETQVYLAAAG